MSRFIIPTDLPLVRSRIVLVALLLVFSIVGSSLCIKMFTKHNDVQNLIKRNVPQGVSVDIDYANVKNATICLFLALNFLTFTASHIVLAFIQDIFQVVPQSYAHRMRIANKRLTSVFLPHQVYALVISTVLVIIPLSFVTFFVFERNAAIVIKSGAVPEETVQVILARLGITAVYKDTSYISIVGEIPWVAVIFAVPSTLATCIAWYRCSRVRPVEEIPSISDNGLQKDKGDEVVYVKPAVA